MLPIWLLAASLTLASCTTTPDAAKHEMVEWLESEGYELPNGAPKIAMVRMPWDKMRYYDGTVYVSVFWQGTDAEKGLLVHEIWHHQQDMERPCLVNEKEAYAIQGEYYRSRGFDLPDFYPEYGASQSCEPVEWAKRWRMVNACKEAGKSNCDINRLNK